MTLKTIKNRITTILLSTSFAVLIGTLGLTPALADNPPYNLDDWFVHNGDPDICYLDSELNLMTVNGTTNQAAAITTAVELTRAEYNSKIDGLTIGAESSCGYNKIEVGAKDLPGAVIGQTTLRAYWCCQYDAQLAEMEIDFDADTDWEINSNECDIFHDKDPEYVANHEMGHALSLDHHNSIIFDHSVMGPTCSQQWSAVQQVDEDALELRYL